MDYRNQFGNYAVPNPSVENLKPRYKDTELVRVEVLAQMATGPLVHGKQMFPNTPILLKGAVVYMHPDQIDEVTTKVKLLDVAEDDTDDTGLPGASDYANAAMRNQVVPVPPALIPEVTGAMSSLDTPTQEQAQKNMEAVGETTLARPSVVSLNEPIADSTDATGGDASVEAVQREASKDAETADTYTKKQVADQQVKSTGPETNKEEGTAKSSKSSSKTTPPKPTENK